MMRAFGRDFKGLYKKEYVVTEVDCWATGSAYAGLEASVKNLGEFSIE